MASTPHPPPKPEPPKPPPKPEQDPPKLKTRDDDHPPPAVREGHVEPHEDHPDDVRNPRPIIGVRGEPIEDGERDPGTIAEEQRQRSREMETAGVEAWKEEHDERAPEDRPGRPLPGVGRLEHDEHDDDKHDPKRVPAAAAKK